MGRPRACIAGAQARLTAGARQGRPVGVVRTARELRGNHGAGYAAAYRALKKSGAAEAPAAGSRGRKWVRCWRACSNAMRHADWHVIGDHRFSGTGPITHLGDASGCVAGAAPLEHAASENAVTPPGLQPGGSAPPRPCCPATDRALRGRTAAVRAGARQPAVLEEPLERDVAPTNTRPRHPQANGRPERFHRGRGEGKEIRRYGSPRGYAGLQRVEAALLAGHRQLRDAAGGLQEQGGGRGGQEGRPRMDGGGTRTGSGPAFHTMHTGAR